jgi:hypothetical protein
VVGGRVVVHLVEAHVNGVALPDSARGQIEQQVQAQLDQTVGAQHVRVSSVRVADGSLAVSGTRQ